MTPHAIGPGISAHKRNPDLSDFAAELDMIQALGVASIELPTYDMDIVIGAKIRRPQLDALKYACAGRDVRYTVHGPLNINFMDRPERLARHMAVLKASVEVAAEVGAVNYVIHNGLYPWMSASLVEDAYARQREHLHAAGDFAREHGVTLCVENIFSDFDGSVFAGTPTRLAQELRRIAHPAVMATLDFSHAYLQVANNGGDFLAEVAALAPLAAHLHLHDSFGRVDDIWAYTEGERLAFGNGDLHMPVGWGDLPWADVMARCTFPQGTVFNIELKSRYWYAAQECVDATRSLMAETRFVAS
jgi:sugar phosphate isomerase/epimerase